jgi:tetratricopeptide (TPR) repeat protein
MISESSCPPNNIEDWLAQTRTAGRQYRKAEPQEAALVKNAVDRAMEGQDGANCGTYMPLLFKASDDLQHGNRAGAEQAIASAEEINRADHQPAEQEGVTYREAAFATSLQTIRAGGRIEPRLNDWVAYQTRGRKRAAEGDNRGAADDFAHAIQMIGATPNPALYFLRGNALAAISDNAGALKMFEAGLSQDPKNDTLKGLIEKTKASMAIR